MDIYKRTIPFSGSTRQVFCLMSDLHLDASDHDRELLVHDLKQARALNARISINGDIFDGILPSDRKRHHPSVMTADPTRDDILNQMVKLAVEVLGPYADLIDVISPGNHERSLLKYHHIDIISMLIYALNQKLPEGAQPIHQGAYRGFQQYSFRKGGKSKYTKQLLIFRHHGRGGAAPVTGGALDLDRIRKDFEADLYWIGHKHGSIGRKFTRISVGSGGRLKARQQRAVMSAGYKQGFHVEDPGADGDIADFGEQFYSVSEQGAQWVVVDLLGNDFSNSAGWDGGMRWTVADSAGVIDAKAAS
jgi:hypothetical protein